MNRVAATLVAVLSAALFGCDNLKPPVAVIAVYDNQTLTCEKAKKIAAKAEKRDSMRQIAMAKVSYCEVASGEGDFVTAGYFDAVEKHYVFRRIEIGAAEAVQGLCLDIVREAGHTSMRRFDTEWGKLDCESMVNMFAERRAGVIVAPSHRVLYIDVDPILVLASGANPQRTGVPEHFYDEVRDLLEKNIETFDAKS